MPRKKKTRRIETLEVRVHETIGVSDIRAAVPMDPQAAEILEPLLNPKRDLARRLKAARMRWGQNQGAAAQAIGGITDRQLRKIEAGRAKPQPANEAAILDYIEHGPRKSSSKVPR